MEKEDYEHKRETRGPKRRIIGFTTHAHLLAAWCRPIWPSWPLSTSSFASLHIYGGKP
jgi:hypothetical protein